MDTLELARSIVAALEDKKGENIILLDLQGVASFTDYFVICTGTSDRMLDALADGVLHKIRDDLHLKGRKDGVGRGGWEVLDYGSVMVHLLAPEQRNYYKLEELWSQGKVLLKLQ